MKLLSLIVLIMLCSISLQSAGKLDACLIFTKADAEALLGQPVKDGRHGIMESDGSGGTAIMSQCVYHTVADYGKSADLVIRKSPSSEKVSASIDTVRKTLKEMATAEPQNISGVGDTAFWAPIGQGAFHSIQLSVFRGTSIYLIISVKGFPDQQALEKAKTIAQKTLSQLPS
jgi:hypothetical protein